MDRGLLTSLVLHRSVTTTEARAKVLKRSADQLLASALRYIKASSGEQLRIRRTTQGLVATEEAVRVALTVLPAELERATTRATRLGFRKGDGSAMMQISLITKPKTETVTTASSEKAKKTVTKAVK